MSEGKFTNGFLLGVIVGGLVVFLWGTKTGKNILKVISEEGLEGLGNLVEEYGLDEESLDDAQDFDGAQAPGEPREPEVNGETTEKDTASPKRRFFKRR